MDMRENHFINVKGTHIITIGVISLLLLCLIFKLCEESDSVRSQLPKFSCKYLEPDDSFCLTSQRFTHEGTEYQCDVFVDGRDPRMVVLPVDSIHLITYFRDKNKTVHYRYKGVEYPALPNCTNCFLPDQDDSPIIYDIQKKGNAFSSTLDIFDSVIAVEMTEGKCTVTVVPIKE